MAETQPQRQPAFLSTDDSGNQFCVAAAERENTGRFIVRAIEKLTAFVELESAIRNRLAAHQADPTAIGNA